MPLPQLTQYQTDLVNPSKSERVFLEGPAGCGKTTAGAARLISLLSSGTPGGSILVLLPQRTLALPYLSAVSDYSMLKGSLPAIITLGGLARRMVDLFWPVISDTAGFSETTRPPVFLTLETAQYYMARAAAPLLEQGYFESLSIDRNRLYSQILDNLNKSALVGFPLTGYADKLKSAWIGLDSQLTLYDQAQECANAFRQYCLAHNLLDYSLQLELFTHLVWQLPLARTQLEDSYRHLIYDNVEEDTPVAHDLLAEWLPSFDTALIIYDQDAGFRSFLGADPGSAVRFKDLVARQVIFSDSFITSPALAAWGLAMRANTLAGAGSQQRTGTETAGLNQLPGQTAADYTQAVTAASHRYQPEMVSWVAGEIERLISQEQASPGEIAILAPILSDALRFMLAEDLAKRGIAVQSHRPSRALREEPVAECLLTLAALAHPSWGLHPTAFEMQKCLMQAIVGLDPVRAHLLTRVAYRVTKGETSLSSFEAVTSDLRERISYLAGNRFDQLKTWLETYQSGEPVELDHFISRLFGEILSQPGFGFQRNTAAGSTAASLVESIRKFRSVVTVPGDSPLLLGPEYIRMVKQGILAAQYLQEWSKRREDAVWISPAYTFLMQNQAVDIQFWLDVGNQAWWERLYQPLTHPHVLSRNWQAEAKWTVQDELEMNQTVLARMVTGLIRRCRRKLYMNYSELSVQGFDQRSPFLRAIQKSLRSRGEG
jgi:hypothetical protein